MNTKIKLLLSTSLLLLFFNCNNDDDYKSPETCLEAPCGTINETATNLTILNTGEYQISQFSISIGGDEVQSISLNGWDFDNENYYTCWQTIPDINENTFVLVQYIYEGEVILITLNNHAVSSNRVVIVLEGDSAQLLDYEQCGFI